MIYWKFGFCRRHAVTLEFANTMDYPFPPVVMDVLRELAEEKVSKYYRELGIGSCLTLDGNQEEMRKLVNKNAMLVKEIEKMNNLGIPKNS